MSKSEKPVRPGYHWLRCPCCQSKLGQLRDDYQAGLPKAEPVLILYCRKCKGDMGVDVQYAVCPVVVEAASLATV